MAVWSQLHCTRRRLLQTLPICRAPPAAKQSSHCSVGVPSCMTLCLHASFCVLHDKLCVYHMTSCVFETEFGREDFDTDCNAEYLLFHSLLMHLSIYYATILFVMWVCSVLVECSFDTSLMLPEGRVVLYQSWTTAQV